MLKQRVIGSASLAELVVLPVPLSVEHWLKDSSLPLWHHLWPVLRKAHVLRPVVIPAVAVAPQVPAEIWQTQEELTVFSYRW